MTTPKRTCAILRTSIDNAERSTTAALRDGARLMADLADASLALSMPLETDQEIIQRAADGLSLLVDSRKRYMELHRRARLVGEKTGLVTGYGECPPAPSAQIVPLAAAS